MQHLTQSKNSRGWAFGSKNYLLHKISNALNVYFKNGLDFVTLDYAFYGVQL